MGRTLEARAETKPKKKNANISPSATLTAATLFVGEPVIRLRARHRPQCRFNFLCHRSVRRVHRYYQLD